MEASYHWQCIDVRMYNWISDHQTQVAEAKKKENKFNLRFPTANLECSKYSLIGFCIPAVRLCNKSQLPTFLEASTVSIHGRSCITPIQLNPSVQLNQGATVCSSIMTMSHENHVNLHSIYFHSWETYLTGYHNVAGINIRHHTKGLYLSTFLNE